MSTLLGIVQAGIGGLFTIGMLLMLGAASAFGGGVSAGRSALLLVCPLMLVAGGLLFLSPRASRWGGALSAAGSAGVTAMVIFLLYSLSRRPINASLAVTAAVVLILVALSDYLSYKMIR